MILQFEEVLSWFERVYGRTLQVVQAVPAEHIFYRSQPDDFTISELIRHIAATELMNGRRIATGKLIYPGHTSPVQNALTEYELALGYLEACHQEAVKHLVKSGEDGLTRLITTNQGEIAGWRVLVGMIEHEIHHRSQLSIYLSGLGIAPPPLFGIYTKDLPHQ